MASVGYNVMLLPVRVLGPCGGYDSDILAGMLWAGGVSSNPTVNPHPARVLNLSLGGGAGAACTAAYTSAIGQLTAAGVVVVVAAGNAEGQAVGAPASCPGVIAVAGVRHTGTKVGFSSIGPEVAIAAPAGNCVNTSGPCLYPILTATNSGQTTAIASTYTDSTNYAVGTSFSTPLVAGTAALMLSANPALTPAQVKSVLQSSARPFPTTSSDPAVQQCHAPNNLVQDECLCTTSTCGAGLLDAAAAVRAVSGAAQPTASVSASASSVLVGATVRFDGSASTAPGARSITAYQWDIVSGAAVAAISGAANAAAVNVVATGVGSFTARLTVTDSTGMQASASSTVSVNAPAAPSVKLLSSASVVSAGSSVSFDGSGSTAAAGLSIVGYQWSLTSGSPLATFSSATDLAAASLVTTGAGSGSFTVKLTVTDSLGQESSASVSVTVTAVAPTASIIASALSVNAGDTVSFDGSGSTAASGRTISAYQWTIASGSTQAAFSGSTTAAKVSVTTGASGSLRVQLTVTDSAGVQDSKSATVTVAAAPVVGGGGGGGIGLVWLFGLAFATAVIARGKSTRPHRQRGARPGLRRRHDRAEVPAPADCVT